LFAKAVTVLIIFSDHILLDCELEPEIYKKYKI
jgi:hypothetical protein